MNKPNTDVGGHDEYWRVDTYRKSSKASLLTALKTKGLIVSSSLDKNAVIEIKQRLDRGMLYYEDSRITVEELLRFVKNRGLSVPITVTRKSLASMLVAADEARTFERFLDLPPELCERVYGFYVRSFPATLSNPTQPPLARTNRLIRKEILPVFYKYPTFNLVFYYPQESVEFGTALSKGTLRPCSETLMFFSQLSGQSKRNIARFDMAIGLKTNEESKRGPSGTMRPIINLDLETRPKQHKVIRSETYPDKSAFAKPSKWEELRGNMIAELKQQWSRISRGRKFAQYFTANDIYMIRGMVEKAFFATYKKRGDWM